jgi:putative nucleotidyltransferase with HDIG domain
MILKLIDWLKLGIKELHICHWKWFHKLAFLTFFTMSLAFFLHFREVRIDKLEHDSIAKKYVLAQVAFDFSDLETTRILREESLRDIGRIYYFDDEDVIKSERQVQDELIRNPDWRQRFPSLTFDDLMIANDKIHNTLLSVEFTDERTVRKLAMMGITSSKFLPYQFDTEGSWLMESVWEQVEKEASSGVEMMEVLHFMLDKYRGYSWKLKEDFNLRHALRRFIKDQIRIKKTHVEAGTRIINAGDKVTQRHLNMLQEMKRVLTEEQHLLKPLTIFGSMGFSIILILVGLVYFYKFHISIFKSFPKMALIAVVILLTLGIAKISEYFILQQPSHLVEMCRFPLYILLTSIVLSVLIDRTIALVVSGFVAIVLGITLAMESHDFLVMNLSTAVLGIIWSKGVRKRKEIFTICSKVWICTIPMVFAINLIENQLWSRQVLNDCLTTGFFTFAIAIFTVAILPLLESVFAIVTDMALMESGDANHPLLRRLSLEAPGTYQHALTVANLAEEAALAIGANALLCRVSALFHDIGKVIQPNYFTENLRDGFDMHQLLTPLESAQVIIQHVTEGIKLAENANLPQPIIEIIREHHGTTLVRYFSCKHLEKNRLKTLGIEEGFFRYPGPTPQTRESAIVMLADSIEAAFRCGYRTGEKAISELIENIVADKIQEHQLDISGLTFEDLEAIKKTIFRSLLAINHVRPAYPTKPPSPSRQPEPQLEPSLYQSS